VGGRKEGAGACQQSPPHRREALSDNREGPLCGERGSRTYTFKKYHKIANY